MKISCVKKASRKRKMTEKMKSLCELDHSRKTSSSKEKVACKRVNDAKNGGDEILNVHSYNEQDMKTIMLVYMQKKSVHDIYFSLRKTYVCLKKEDKSFYSFCNDSKSPSSHMMIKLISSWLVFMKKIVVKGCTSLSAKNVQLLSL
ncbi:hypothetical protein GOP47_0024892 [Adiantum capillus-veneris]|uniref:Uncharacterized protein n=1 Tax=Adiantum capillus-veneris TaxID=13818 RepID=A0A9D4Z4R3_ADICA|nr:hypothetical protein GOP47_0024892 [Adiantum capillus-veneris]